MRGRLCKLKYAAIGIGSAVLGGVLVRSSVLGRSDDPRISRFTGVLPKNSTRPTDSPAHAGNHDRDDTSRMRPADPAISQKQTTVHCIFMHRTVVLHTGSTGGIDRETVQK